MASTDSSFKASWDSIVQVMSNLGASASDFMLIIQAFSYIAAIFCVVRGIMLMPQMAHGNYRKGNSSLFNWFWSLVVGVLLFALPETLSVLGSTFLPQANTSPLAYSGYMNQGQGLAMGSCQLGGLRPLFVVIGFISVIRGLLVFRTVGMNGGGHGNETFARGAILCVAGILLVHMQETLALINQVTGLNLGAGLC